MANKKLTETGKLFIRRVATYFNGIKGNTSLLQGNNGKLPFSNSPSSKIWIASITNIYTNKPITNNNELAEYIILLYDDYAQQSLVDANVMAAQGYKESEYRIWVYNDNISTASGIAQILMHTMYDIIYTYKWLSNDEKNLILIGFELPERASSWKNVSQNTTTADVERQERNRSILHQNMINNLHIMIKSQCRLMDFISKRNNNLAASALFAYNRGSSLESKNYIELVNNRAKDKGNENITEGVNYVEAIFRYLGDQNHDKLKNPATKLNTYVKGYWFGYKQIDFGFESFASNANSSVAPDESIASSSALIVSLRNGYEHAVKKFTLAHPGFTIKLSSVYRTPKRQNELYQEGRDSRGNIIGKTLTPVSGIAPNLSKHNYYNTKAFDYNIFNSSGVYLDGKNIAIYRPLYQEFFDYVREIEPNAIWGGTFRNQANDVVHIQVA